MNQKLKTLDQISRELKSLIRVERLFLTVYFGAVGSLLACDVVRIYKEITQGDDVQERFPQKKD